MAIFPASLTPKNTDDSQALARRIAQQLPARSRVLEIAPGPGHFAIALAQLGDYRITGLDISEAHVDIARANAREANVRVDFREGSPSAMRLPGCRFDFILCRAAFKDFSEPAEALSEIHRVLKPSGRALIMDLRRETSLLAKLTFRKPSYTKSEFDVLISAAQFACVKMVETPAGLEVLLTKGGSPVIPPFGSLAPAESLCYTSE